MAFATTTLTPEEFAKILQHSKPELTKAVRSWLLAESAAFVGSGKKDGSFTKYLMAKDRKYRGGKWQRFLARSFSGKIEHENDVNRMSISMGLRADKLKKMPFIEALADGANISTRNSSWLWIPNYKNLLADGVGLYGRRGSRGKNSFAKLLHDMEDRLTMFYYHGRMLVFGDTPDVGGSHKTRHEHMLNRKLLFVGVKNVKVKKQFDFYTQWLKRVRKIDERLEKRIGTTLKRIGIA